METLLQIGLANAACAAVLALVAFAVDRAFRRPALSHFFWLLVLVKLLTPPLVRVPLPWPAAAARAPAPAEYTAREADAAPVPVPPAARGRLQVFAPSLAPEPRETKVPWPALAVAAWLGGSVLWWGVAALRVARFSRVLRLAEAAPPEVRERTRQLAARLGLWRCPEVVFVHAAVSPLVWAPGRSARLLLPAALWARLDDGRRDGLLVHELAHLRRGDHWVRRLELAALGLYWWHPAAWWARRELQDAEERCCDGWVARVLPDSGPAYAAALVETVAFVSAARAAVPLGASGSGQVRQLKRRLTMILEGKTAKPLGWCALAAALAVGAVLVALAPGSAEPPAVVPTVATVAAEQDSAAPARSVPRSGGSAVKYFSSGVTVPRVAEGPATAEKRAATPAAQPDPIEAAREEVELEETRLKVKREQLAASKVAVQIAQEKAANATTKEQRNAAMSEVRSGQADLRVREAELLEPELRLKQAKRRLNALLEAVGKEHKEASKPNPRWFDGVRPEERLREELEQLRREMESLRKELRHRNAGDAGAGAGIGGAPAEAVNPPPSKMNLSPRERRMLRWVIEFDTENGDEYLRQLRGLGAVLAIPKGDKDNEYAMIRDPGARPPKLLDEDLSKIERIYWIDDKPSSVARLVHALGLTKVPGHFVAFLPKEVEEKLFREELKYKDRKEDQIFSTRFRVRRENGQYVPFVVGQTEK